MKALVYVIDTSLRGEYSAVVQLLKGLGYEVVPATTRPLVNINPRVELREDNVGKLAEEYDLLALVGGYSIFYEVTRKKPPRRDWENVVDSNVTRNLVERFIGGKTLLAPFMVPALLALYGYLRGRKATVYPLTELIRILVENGANFVNKPYVVDGGVITVKDVRRINIKELVEVVK